LSHWIKRFSLRNITDVFYVQKISVKYVKCFYVPKTSDKFEKYFFVRKKCMQNMFYVQNSISMYQERGAKISEKYFR